MTLSYLKIALLALLASTTATAFQVQPGFSASKIALKGAYEEYMKERGISLETPQVEDPVEPQEWGLFEEYMASRGHDTLDQFVMANTASARRGPKSAKPLPKPGRQHPGSSSNYLNSV